MNHDPQFCDVPPLIQQTTKTQECANSNQQIFPIDEMNSLSMLSAVIIEILRKYGPSRLAQSQCLHFETKPVRQLVGRAIGSKI